MPLSEPVRKQIQDLISSHRVVLFMKGSRRMPMCGFSGKVVQILDEHLPEYETLDVLRAPEIREGIKEFSKWPTIPQLYVGGKFVGGSDIVTELNVSGELGELLGAKPVAVPAPKITMSAAAKAAFDAALADAGGDLLRFKIDADYQNDLFLGPREAGDIEVDAGGLTLLLDRGTASRADGVRIDFVDGEGGGFKLENPNAPAHVIQIGAVELKAMLDRGEVVLFDVRPENERRIAKIDGARSLDAAGQEYLSGLDRNTAIAFHCHHGPRSDAFAQRMLAEGFKKVYNLKGGISAWTQSVDPSVPNY